MHELFLQLTSLTQTPKLHSLLQSPFGLHGAILAKLEREAEHALAGKPARIIAKINALVDPQAIEALYRASAPACRSISSCAACARCVPGVPGVSDNIRVRSILGRFLEHSRVFYFENAGAPQMYCSSADWMERNFFRRVEVAFPIMSLEHRERILRDLNTYLKDNCQAWLLSADGTYVLAAPRDEAPLSVQADLLGRYAAASGFSL